MVLWIWHGRSNCQNYPSVCRLRPEGRVSLVKKFFSLEYYDSPIAAPFLSTRSSIDRAPDYGSGGWGLTPSGCATLQRVLKSIEMGVLSEPNLQVRIVT